MLTAKEAAPEPLRAPDLTVESVGQPVAVSFLARLLLRLQRLPAALEQLLNVHQSLLLH